MSAVRVVSPCALAGAGLGLSGGNLFLQFVSVVSLVALVLFVRSTALHLAAHARQAQAGGKHR